MRIKPIGYRYHVQDLAIFAFMFLCLSALAAEWSTADYQREVNGRRYDLRAFIAQHAKDVNSCWPPWYYARNMGSGKSYASGIFASFDLAIPRAKGRPYSGSVRAFVRNMPTKPSGPLILCDTGRSAILDGVSYPVFDYGTPWKPLKTNAITKPVTPKTNAPALK